MLSGSSQVNKGLCVTVFTLTARAKEHSSPEMGLLSWFKSFTISPKL